MNLSLTILTSLICIYGDCSESKDWPNHVVFITDDRSFSGISCTGNSVLKTPHLDQVWFEQVVNGRDRHLTTIMEAKASQFLADTQTHKEPYCFILALREPHGPLDYLGE